MTIILETPRLVLREMSLADLDFVAVMLADPEVMRYYPKCCSREEAENWVQRQLHHRHRVGRGRRGPGQGILGWSDPWSTKSRFPYIRTQT